jgi:phage tail-like protein
MAINVATNPGDHALAFRLQLLGAGGPYDVELPGVYVDQIVLDAVAERIVLFNRDPEPDEEAVPVNQTIAVDLGDSSTSGTGFGTTDVDVYVNGVLAYTGGAFQTGFTGPQSSASFTTERARLLIDSNDPLSGDTVQIRVVATAAAAPLANIDETYEFDLEDITAPIIVEVLPTSKTVIQVTFDEPMESTSSTGANDTLNPALYGISLVEGDDQTKLPAVQVEASSVTKISEAVFDVTLNIEMTPQASYDLVADGVKDISGNEILPPNDTARFVGFQPDVPENRSFNLLDMLPDMNLLDDETQDLEHFIGCYQEVVDLMLCDIDGFGNVLDPDLAPENFVDAMLRDLGNPFDFELSLTDKRRLLLVLVPIYKQKGTDPGIINAIRFFMGIETTIEVQALTGTSLGVGTLGGTMTLGSTALADLLTFCVIVPRTLTEDEEAKMAKIVAYMMRGECHFKIVAPSLPTVIDHWQLGVSQLGLNTIMH